MELLAGDGFGVGELVSCEALARVRAGAGAAVVHVKMVTTPATAPRARCLALLHAVTTVGRADGATLIGSGIGAAIYSKAGGPPR